MKIYRVILFFAGCFSFLSACSQLSKLRYYTQIQEYKSDDKKSFPPKNAILFVGSSSIRLWENLSSYFPGFNVINRGFGGSELKDVIYYADDIILPYYPKQVIIYCGENDIATGEVTANDAVQNFTKLFGIIRKALPQAHVVFISMKPSPSRRKFMPVMEDANEKIRNFLDGQPRTAFVDVYHKMLGKDGLGIPELFRSDSLHMTQKGYDLWKEAVLPVLEK